MSHRNKLLPVDFLKFAAEHQGVLSFDCETTGKNAFTCKPLLYTLSAGSGNGIHSISMLPSEMTHKFLNMLFTDPGLKIIMHNSSFDCKIVHRFICKFRKIRATIIDTMVLAWLVDNRGARKYGKPFRLKSLSQHYLGHKMATLEDVFKTGPLALRRHALETRARKLGKGWHKLAKRHEARTKRFMRQQHAIARELMKSDTTLTSAEKKSAGAALTQKYQEYSYDYKRAEVAAKRWLAMMRREHTALSAAIQAQFVEYALDDAAVALRLFWLFRKKLVKLRLDKWARIELMCRNFATDMEINGVEIDYAFLDKLDKSFGPEIDSVTQTCYRLAGEAAKQATLPFNLQSPREVSVILHSLVGAFPDARSVQLEETADSIENREKNPAAAPWFKTNKRVLQYTKHPLAKAILDYRSLSKLRGTYTDKLKKVRGRLHSFFRSSGTDTGRFSCVAAWTPVLTRDGYKRIDQVRTGDLVWTHKQRWMPVTRTIIKGVDHMYDLHLSNGNILTCTTDHKVLLSDGVSWKTVGGLIHECEHQVGRVAAQREQSAEAVSVSRIANRKSNCRKAWDHASERYLGATAALGPRDLQSTQGCTVLAIQNGQQEPNDKQNRHGPSQLERRLPRRIRLFDQASERQASFCAPTRDGRSTWPVCAAENVRGSSHRRGSDEQRPEQLGIVHQRRTQRYPQLAGRDSCTTIEKVNYRGRLAVYDLTVETDHSYFACGSYQHNSSGPNLQNIPSRSKIGKKIRQAFVARKGYVLIVADLSQIELRVLATVCNETNMLNTFNEYKIREDGTRDYTVGDIHAVTQKGLQEVCPFDVTREHAKVCNFALGYGQSAISFALLYLLAFEVGEALRNAFFDKYPMIMATMLDLGEKWRYYGIRSWRIPFSGRLRHWDRYDFVYDPDTGEAYRTDTRVSKGNILNTISQGSAADIFKMALRAFWQWVVLHEDFDEAIFPLMQVHDEVVVEVREDIAVFIAKLLKYCMEYAWFDTPCPILADVHIVDRWSEGKNGKRELLDAQGKSVLGEDGKPLFEDVRPEMNKELKYLTPADIEACQQYIPQLNPIEIYTSFVVSKEELAALAS